MLLQACLNGAWAPGRHPALPATPAELAREAGRAVRSGAGALHLHPRDAAGRESLDDADVSAALAAVRAACPGVPVGVSSGFWMLNDELARLRAVVAWTARPNFVSVNWHEPGAPELALILLARGIGVEAGLVDLAAAESYARWPWADQALRVLVEIDDRPDAEASRAALDVLGLLDEAGVRPPRLLHGAGSSAWPLLDLAGRLGLDTRIGLEDTLSLPDGRPAAHNGELVAEAARRLGRTLI